MTEKYIKALQKRGFTIDSIKENTTDWTGDYFSKGPVIIEAKVETKRGTLSVYCGTNGTCRVDKPNGTHKWLYQKTMPQLFRAIDQSLAFYK